MYYQKSIATILKELDTNPNLGLTSNEARIRLQKYGLNILPTTPPPSILVKFLNQFKSVLVIILILATILSALLGDTLDAIAIFAIVILNATIGTIQEAKAEKTLQSLESKDIPYTLCLRDGRVEKLKVIDIVPGDILVLEGGVKVPADCRIIESYQLSIDESILTGESLPVAKTQQVIAGQKTLGDQINMAFKNTEVTAGRGKGVVVQTGINTQIGKIAKSLEKTTDEKTPLTRQLDKVGRMLTLTIIIIASSIFIITGIQGLPLIDRILIAIALAVAAIPEGLPAIATITLALGVERLAKKKTIVKKLPSVETLGSVKLIATDKTGTITENKLNVVEIVTKDGQSYTVESEGYSTWGIYRDKNGKDVDPLKIRDLLNLLYCATLANNASIKRQDDSFKTIGDTTEGALLIASQRAGISIDRLNKEFKRVFEIPFSEHTKTMSVVCKVDDTNEAFIFSKGAPEEIIKMTNLSPHGKKEILKLVQSQADQGLRVLAFARKILQKSDLTRIIEKNIIDLKDLEFLGIIGQKDTLRLDIRQALEKARIAGIKTVMITGDHAQTATNIGLESGIIDRDSSVITEESFTKLSNIELSSLIAKDKFRIFARISPLGKLKLVSAMKLIPNANIAVTGDGVNDAPALKAAHVGIAMGSGTDIAKEVSDMIITDDNYATIVEAIKEGRIIFANLIKFIRYLISCNLAEVFVVVFAVIFTTPLPLLPIQLLWINLITDGLPALALGDDPPEFDVMLKPPTEQSQILHRRRWGFMISEGLIMGISVFLLYLFALLNYNLPTAQTMAFTALSVSQLVHALNNRSTRTSIFKLGLFSNKSLIIAITISLLLQFLAVHSNFGHYIFKTVALSYSQWAAIAVIAIIPFIFVELKKVGLKKLNI